MGKLYLVRHAKAGERRLWDGDDRDRPLSPKGWKQAELLASRLASLDVSALYSSPYVRCVQTVQPYVDEHVLTASQTVALSEEHLDPDAARDLVDGLLADTEPTVLCSHRPVLPWVCEALGIDAVKLDPGAFLVVHHRAGTVLATEHHQVR